MSRRPRPSREAGSLYIVEAVAFATLALMAVAFVVTFETPTTSDQQVAADIELLVQSALDAWAGETPTEPGSPYETRLEQFVAEALVGDGGNLPFMLERILPPGARYAVVLETGNGTMHVAGPTWSGQTTMLAHHGLFLAPTATFLDTDFAYYSGEFPMTPAAIMVKRGRVLEPGGIPLNVRVTTEDAATGAERVTRALYATAQRQPDGAEPPFVSLHFVSASGTAKGYAGSGEFGAPDANGARPLTLRLAAAESNDLPLPVGTRLTLHSPAGWAFQQFDGAAACPRHWYNCSVDIPGDGPGTVSAQLAEPLRAETFPFNLTVGYAEWSTNQDRFAAWRAEFSGGNLGVAELLVQLPNTASTARNEVHVLASVPRPMGAGSLNKMVLAVGNAKADPVYVTRIEVEPREPGLFGEGAQVVGGGWSKVGTRFVWTGEHLLAAGSAFHWTPDVQAAPFSQGHPTHLHREVPLEYSNGFAPALFHGLAPGVRRDAVRAEAAADVDPGYDDELGVHAFETRASEEVPAGRTDYEVLALPLSELMQELHAAHADSAVSFSRSVARPGQTIEVTADFESLMEKLAAAGDLGPRNVSVETRVYSPLSFAGKVPWRTFEVPENELGHPSIYFIEPANVNGDATLDLLVAKGDSVYALDGADPEGDWDTKFWKRDFAGHANALLEVVDWDGDAVDEVLVVSANGEIALLNKATGVREAYWNLDQGISAAHLGDDCDGDGGRELLLGTVDHRDPLKKMEWDGPGYVGLDDLSPAAANDIRGWIRVFEPGGEVRVPGVLPIHLGFGTKVRDLANGTYAAERVCGFAVAEANGHVKAFDGTSFNALLDFDTGVPWEQGGATQVVSLETDQGVPLDQRVDEVVFGDGVGWVTVLDSEEPEGAVGIVDMSAQLPDGDELVDVDMIGADVGFAVSKKGRIFTTEDGWENLRLVALIPLAAQETVTAFDHYDQSVGLLFTSERAIFYTNRGWTSSTDLEVFLPGVAADVEFVNEERALVAHDYASNRGLSWVSPLLPPSERVTAFAPAVPHALSAIWLESPTNGYVAGRGGFSASVYPDASTWEALPLLPTNLAGQRDSVVAISAIANHVLIGTANGTIYSRAAQGPWVAHDASAAGTEEDVSWTVTTNEHGTYTFNTAGTSGYALFNRSGEDSFHRVRGLIPDAIRGASKGNAGDIVAVTATHVLQVEKHLSTPRWSALGAGGVETLSTNQGYEFSGIGQDVAFTSRLSVARVAGEKGHPEVLDNLDQESKANYGRLRLYPSDGAGGFAVGTYAVGANLPLPAQDYFLGPPPGLLDFNSIKRFEADGQETWTRLLSSDSGDNVLALAGVQAEDRIYGGRNNGRMKEIQASDGAAQGDHAPGDLVGIVKHLLPLPSQILYGPYIFESSFAFELSELGTTVAQAARAVDYIYVLPPRQNEYMLNVYNVQILVWLPGWDPIV